MKYTCSMETVQQNGRFTLFSSKFSSNIYSILFVCSTWPVYCLLNGRSSCDVIRTFKYTQFKWIMFFLRRSLQTSIINNVQRTAHLQNIVLPNIYYTIRETHCHLIGDPTIFILDPRFSLTSQGLSSETPTFSLETSKSIIGDIKSFIVDTESFIVDTKSFIVDTKSFIVDPRFLLETLRCS